MTAGYEVGDEGVMARVPAWLRRLAVHPLMLMPVGVAMIAFAAVLAGIVLQQFHPDGKSVYPAFGGLFVGLCGLAAYRVFRRRVARAAPEVSAPTRTARELAAGLLGGFVLFSMITAIVALMGGFGIVSLRGMGDVWVWLGIAFYSGMVEEVVFRGVVQRQIEAAFGTWTALAATSAFFGLAHLVNPGASLFAAFAIACEAGILLGAAWLVTGRRLAAPIGLHMAWNFTQGWVFSIPVSGSEPPQGLLVTRLSGPEWLTGGTFGLEASVVALMMASTFGVALLMVARRNGLFLPWQPRRQTNE